MTDEERAKLRAISEVDGDLYEVARLLDVAKCIGRREALEEAADKVGRLMRTATPEQCAAAIRTLIGETK